MRTGTGFPCGRPAATELPGVPFCERCAREQEDYFAIGELTRAPRGRRAVTGSLGRDTRMPRPRASAKRRRRSRETAAKSGKIPSLLVILVLASALASAACGGTGEAGGGSVATDPEAGQGRGAGGSEERPQAARTDARGNEHDGAVARAGDAGAGADGTTTARTGGARAGTGSTAGTTVVGNGGEYAQEGNVERKDAPRKITLRVTGDPGTRFAGACSVGGRERTIDGRVPERYAFEPLGKKLECEIRKEGEGALKIVFSDGEGARSVQRTGVGEGTVRFAYSGGGLSSSTSSISVDQTVVTSGKSSIVSSSNKSP